MGEAPICCCGIPAIIKTAWIAENPGKKFYGSPYYEHHNGRDGYGCFKWHETSDCEINKEVKDLETDVEERKHKVSGMNLMLFMAIVTVIYQWLWKE